MSINVGMSRSIVKFSCPFLEVMLRPCLTADVDVMVYPLETPLPMNVARTKFNRPRLQMLSTDDTIGMTKHQGITTRVTIGVGTTGDTGLWSLK